MNSNRGDHRGRTRGVLALALVVGAVCACAVPAHAGGIPPDFVAGAPAPPGGHIPVYFAGANTGSYPVLPTDVPGAQPGVALGRVWASPNPFANSTVIHFAMADPRKATLRVYDVQGRCLRTIEHVVSAAGEQSVAWDGRNAEGAPLSPGVYFYRLSAGDRSVVQKLLLMR